MNRGISIFSQIMDFLPKHKFRRCVNRYGGNYRVLSFTCFDQFMCMAFAQLTYRESLRDIECCLRALREKLYHIGIRGKVSRSTIAYANENRDWRIYCDFAQILSFNLYFAGSGPSSVLRPLGIHPPCGSPAQWMHQARPDPPRSAHLILSSQACYL